MKTVSFSACASYEPEILTQALERLLLPLGGMPAFVRPGQRVLLKPNLLSADPPEKRITTDPALVLAVGRLVRQAGGQIIIADSPALDSFKKVSQKTGMTEVAKELNAELRELNQPRPAPADPRAVFKSLELAELALSAEVIINLPKLKTHSQMLLTLGVKNLFGAVVAQRKAEWHHMAGLKLDIFADLLLDIYLALQPALTILDGIWGMEGQGPSNGTPRNFALLAASPDALSLDMAVCRLLGAPWERLPLYRAARARGLLKPEREDTPGLEQVSPPFPPLRLPELGSLSFLPGRLKFLENLSRRYLVSRPAQNPERCMLCGKCLSICPEKCIRAQGKILSFNYNRCIRCYCCQEVCPANAIVFQKGWLAKILTGLGR